MEDNYPKTNSYGQQPVVVVMSDSKPILNSDSFFGVFQRQQPRGVNFLPAAILSCVTIWCFGVLIGLIAFLLAGKFLTTPLSLLAVTTYQLGCLYETLETERHDCDGTETRSWVSETRLRLRDYETRPRHFIWVRDVPEISYKAVSNVGSTIRTQWQSASAQTDSKITALDNTCSSLYDKVIQQWYEIATDLNGKEIGLRDVNVIDFYWYPRSTCSTMLLNSPSI